MSERDNLFNQPVEPVSQFSFDERVARVFQDMINRSVPGYAHVLAMTGVLAARHLKEGSVCYDLGCSLGESLASVIAQVRDKHVRFIGVDNSEPMLSRCRHNLEQAGLAGKVELVCSDIESFELERADAVIMNYTLQFISSGYRTALIEQICKAMNPGGILMIADKIHFESSEIQDLITDYHLDFKRANGYSELEISQKRAALEDVLVSDTVEVHLERLKRAGFSKVCHWFNSLNFAAILAIK